MNCVICSKNDWQDVDEFRLKKSGMCMCKNCGFISYPKLYKTEEEIKEYYRKEYRQPPTSANFFTGQKKILYHRAFLAQLFDQWTQKGKKEPVICDIGAAHGMFLAWIKSCFPGAKTLGTELTKSYRRSAWNEYGIYLSEDFDDCIKYDLITSYKVAEHQLDVDKLLIKYKEALKENGFIYISVPIWFNQLCNFGVGGFDIEYYYHTNHINVWTRKLFRTLLNKVGLEILVENTTYYDDTFLCKRNDALMKIEPEYEKPEIILNNLKKVKQASDYSINGELEKAVESWPNFPLAHMNIYEKNRGIFHREGFEFIHEKILKTIIKFCPESHEIMGLVADICMRYEKYDLAKQYLDRVLEMQPESPPALLSMAQIFRQMARKEVDEEKQFDLIRRARDICMYVAKLSPRNMPEARNWFMRDNAILPMKGD